MEWGGDGNNGVSHAADKVTDSQASHADQEMAQWLENATSNHKAFIFPQWERIKIWGQNLKRLAQVFKK